MAAGIASLDLLKRENPYPALDAAGEQIAEALRNAAADHGLPLQVPQAGSMFCLFFSENPVLNGEDAKSSETGLFAKLFHHALKNGVYLPPSAFETCFISSAHSNEDIARTCDVLTRAVSSL